MTADILEDLRGVVAEGIDRHGELRRKQGTWSKELLVPYKRGKNYNSEPYRGSDSRFSEEVQIALEVGAATEDGLPWYVAELYARFGRDPAWREWLGIWTAEENLHSLALHEFIAVTRALSPERMEAARSATVAAGYSADGKDPLRLLVYVSLQELATRISHHNTGLASRPYDAEATALLSRIAKDENNHFIFYRDLVSAALQIAPSETVKAIYQEVRTFKMPGDGIIPDFRDKALVIASSGIYNLEIHQRQVVRKVLDYWKVFAAAGLDDSAKRSLDMLARRLHAADKQAEREPEMLELAMSRRKGPAKW